MHWTLCSTGRHWLHTGKNSLLLRHCITIPVLLCICTLIPLHSAPVPHSAVLGLTQKLLDLACHHLAALRHCFVLAPHSAVLGHCLSCPTAIWLLLHITIPGLTALNHHSTLTSLYTGSSRPLNHVWFHSGAGWPSLLLLVCTQAPLGLACQIGCTQVTLGPCTTFGCTWLPQTILPTCL